MTLQHFRERLVLILLCLLPFHAFLVTVLTKMIAGPAHAPLSALAIWKEGLLGFIVFFALLELVQEWKVQKYKRIKVIVDFLDVLILFLTVWAFFISFIHFRTSGTFVLSHFLLGFKYDLLPLLAFLILRRVDWSDSFQKALVRILIAVGCIVALYAIIAEFLPLRFFVWLGYSDLHSLYVANGPLAAFQELEGGMMRRAQSSMSGPNQLGLWLLIPLGVLLSASRKEGDTGKRFGIGVLLLTALALSFSRAAWIAAAAMMLLVLARSTFVLQYKKLCGVIFGFVVCFGIAIILLFPSVFLRLQSSSDHIRKPIEAIGIMIAHPLGLGLGTAGPASNRFSDTCVQLPKGSDWSWANNRQDLCVFVDGVQMQPVGRSCSCPLLTENWYLQIGVELGVMGFVLYLMLTLFMLRRLAEFSIFPFGPEGLRASNGNFQFSIFLGLSIAALFLHAFEDSAVVYTIWVLLAVAFATLPLCQRPFSRSQGPSSSSTSADSTRI